MFSVQYHPEASPGPRDSHYLFQRFADLMRAEEAGITFYSSPRGGGMTPYRRRRAQFGPVELLFQPVKRVVADLAGLRISNNTF